MNLQPSMDAIRNLENVIKRAHRNARCIFSGCNCGAIGSHLIARSTLELIADQGHVLAWMPQQITAWDMMRSVNAGQSIELLYEEPILVGISNRNWVTEPLFCSIHDGSIFAPLEHEDFSFRPQQIALLAYRALCSLVFSMASIERVLTSLAENHDGHGVLGSTQTLRKVQQFQTTELILQVRQLYEQMRSESNYTLLDWSTNLMNIPPCIAATYAFIPVENNEDKAIANGKLAVSTVDAVIYSFLPYKPQESSACVISWLKGSTRAQRFMNNHQIMSDHQINEVTETEQQDLFLSLAFQSPTLYISPTWWRSLSDEERERYKRIHLDTYSRHNQLD